MRRGPSAAALLLPVLLCVLCLLTACGDGSGGSTETRTIQVTISDGTVSPAGDRIDVDVNQPIDIVITSDVDGVMHIHSSPEQTKNFVAGDNDPIELQFDRPGVVEVELHEPFEGPVVSLEVS